MIIIRNCTFRNICLFIITTYIFCSLYSCNSATENRKASSAKKVDRLVIIPKDTLLSCIAEAVKITSLKGCNLEKLKQVFILRSGQYKLDLFPGSDYSVADQESVLVTNTNRSESPCNITIYIPRVLQEEILFSDLKSRFGDWQSKTINGIPVPQPKIPITRFVFTSNLADTVYLNVQSRDIPEQKNNSIFNINILKY